MNIGYFVEHQVKFGKVKQQLISATIQLKEQIEFFDANVWTFLGIRKKTTIWKLYNKSTDAFMTTKAERAEIRKKLCYQHGYGWDNYAPNDVFNDHINRRRDPWQF